MQRLTELEEHEVGYVDNVVDWIESDALELVPEPLWRLSHLHPAYGESTVPWCTTRVIHPDIQAAALAFAERIHARAHEFARDAIVAEVRIQVAGHTPVGGGVNPVGRDFIFDDGAGLQFEVFLRRGADHRVFREHHNALVAASDSELILGANHTEGLHSPDL